PATVTVKATSAADTSKSDSATVIILPAADIWTWMSGSSTGYQTGTYGTRGVADPRNVPGARRGAVSWSDSQGRFWLFGGDGWDSAGAWDLLNDLWRYDPSSKKWTWVSGSDTRDQPASYGTKGVASPANVPGARMQAESWIDVNGNLWLFGGIGFIGTGEFGELNDLWKYDPSSDQWTWVSGSSTLFQAGSYGIKGTADPSNVPGARSQAACWIDSSENLWLFGGMGYDSVGYYAGDLIDLWRFDPATREWTWVAGSNAMDGLAAYGTKGLAAATNIPGARCGAASWIDGNGYLWLFGGDGWGSDFAANTGLLDDLWKFDPTTLEWTWVAGSNSLYQPATYGTKGTPEPSNNPGARRFSLSWIDTAGNFWLFGGDGYYAPDQGSLLNDLWKYDPTTLAWVWVSGGETGYQAGVYGIEWTIDPSNVPGGRNVAVSWIDAQDCLWLFGGYGYDMSGNDAHLNDLWRYIR
ncbi:MAG: Kelch repeat-containing protein, partial [Candidatus Aminicenantales bacterium]